MGPLRFNRSKFDAFVPLSKARWPIALDVWLGERDKNGVLYVYRTSAAARAVSLKLAAQHPDALIPAEVVRLPGLDPRYVPAVRLRFGAAVPKRLTGVRVLEAEPPPPPSPTVKPAKQSKAHRPEPVEPKRPHRTGQRDKLVVLIRRPEGATSHELVDALGVLPHSIRSLLSNLRQTMNIERGGDGRYRLRE